MLSASCIPLNDEGFDFSDAACIKLGTYVINCYGMLAFIDDIDHARTYWHYGTIVADVIEAIRTIHFKEIFEWDCVAEFRSRYGNRIGH